MSSKFLDIEYVRGLVDDYDVCVDHINNCIERAAHQGRGSVDIKLMSSYKNKSVLIVRLKEIGYKVRVHGDSCVTITWRDHEKE